MFYATLIVATLDIILKKFKKLFIALSASAACYAGTAAASMPFTAKSWLVADKNGAMIDGNNTEEVRAIASITKLMTVMVVLDAQQDLSEIISTRKLSRRELISLAIVHSDNDAARILCENYPSGSYGCIRAMNNKAEELGMLNTHFIEPTGLSVFNVSTAQSLVKLVLAASKYSVINEDSNKDVVKIRNKKQVVQFHNTNSWVGKGQEFKVSKTGWITKSGGCIVMMVATNNNDKIVVLLGSKNTHTRIPEAKMIALAY